MGFLSVTEYANKYSRDPGNVRRMLLCGRLDGFKIGNQWVLDENAKYPEDKRIRSRKYIVYSISELAQMIKPILAKYNAESAKLFGSYARNEATKNSDIDLMIDGGNNFDPTDVFSIADDLYEASGKNVDVYEKREISKGSDIYWAILHDGVTIQ